MFIFVPFVKKKLKRFAEFDNKKPLAVRRQERCVQKMVLFTPTKVLRFTEITTPKIFHGNMRRRSLTEARHTSYFLSKSSLGKAVGL